MFCIRPAASLVFALASLSLPASEPIVIQPSEGRPATEVRTVSLPSGSSLKIKNVNGYIHVVAWDKEQVEFTGAFKPSSRDEQVKVVIETTSKGLDIRGEYPKKGGRMFYRGPECRMDLKVPRKVLPYLETVNGEVQLTGTSGSAEIHSVNGSVLARGLEEALKAKTVNGGITLENVKGGLNLSTVNGGISGWGLDGNGQGLEASTVNGAILLQITGIRGHLQASTVNGSLSFNAQGAQQVEIHKQHLSAVFPGGDQKITLSTVNGSITLK